MTTLIRQMEDIMYALYMLHQKHNTDWTKVTVTIPDPLYSKLESDLVKELREKTNLKTERMVISGIDVRRAE